MATFMDMGGADAAPAANATAAAGKAGGGMSMGGGTCKSESSSAFCMKRRVGRSGSMTGRVGVA